MRLRNPGLGSAEVAQQLAVYLKQLANAHDLNEAVQAALLHIQGVTQRYAPGLSHCYEIIGLPRTNNDLERGFRALTHHEWHITDYAQTRARPMRYGAWLLLNAPPLSEAELRQRLIFISAEAYWEEGAWFRPSHPTASNMRLAPPPRQILHPD